jgi:hypothetical protein
MLPTVQCTHRRVGVYFRLTGGWRPYAHLLDKFDAADKIGPAKDLIDSAYTIYREATSFSLLSTFNDNADRYLEASTKLSQRMVTLVNAQKALAASSK